MDGEAEGVGPKSVGQASCLPWNRRFHHGTSRKSVGSGRQDACPTTIIGIGNPDRGDDAAGRQVARLLRRRLPENVDVVEYEGEAIALLARLDGVAAAFLVDACASGAQAGTVYRFDAAVAPLPQCTFGLSTHGFGLGEAVELARALGKLPARCIVYAIEGESFELGAPLSPAVREAIGRVAQRLVAEIAGNAACEGTAYQAWKTDK